MLRSINAADFEKSSTVSSAELRERQRQCAVQHRVHEVDQPVVEIDHQIVLTEVQIEEVQLRLRGERSALRYHRVVLSDLRPHLRAAVREKPDRAVHKRYTRSPSPPLHVCIIRVCWKSRFFRLMLPICSWIISERTKNFSEKARLMSWTPVWLFTTTSTWRSLHSNLQPRLLWQRDRRDFVRTRGVVTPRQRFLVENRQRFRVAPHAHRPQRIHPHKRNSREVGVVENARHAGEAGDVQLGDFGVSPVELEHSLREGQVDTDHSWKRVGGGVVGVDGVEGGEHSAVLTVELIVGNANEEEEEEKGEKRAENHRNDALQVK